MAFVHLHGFDDRTPAGAPKNEEMAGEKF